MLRFPSMKNSFELAKRKGTIKHEKALKQYNEEFGETIGFEIQVT